MRYRTEIDGLRAFAVVPVILYHAGYEYFGGGYVGVDVFFVISGYLITSIIVSEIDNEKFDLLYFYERRARRILPALVFISVCCIPFSFYMLLPHEMLAFSKSLIAIATFSSNFLFLSESRYFGPDVDLIPLIHTWSLAVEEQYYILFPLLLMFVQRFCRQVAFLVLAAIFLLSLTVSHWAAYNSPNAAFYMIHTRAWELLLGAFAGLLLRQDSIVLPIWMSNILSIAGLIAISYAVFAFDKSTPFPGLYALVPTVGTLLIILFAARGTVVQVALSLNAFTGLGLVSYSLYLWHQPIFAFFRIYQNGHDFNPTYYAILICLALACAIMTYQLIEKPFRTSKGHTKYGVLAASFFSLLFCACLGAVGLYKDGFPNRYSDWERELLSLSDYKNYFDRFDIDDCFVDYGQSATRLITNECMIADSDKPRIVLFGDSEAAHLTFGIKEAVGSKFTVLQWTGASCAPMIFSSTDKRCREFYNKFNSQFIGKLTDNDVLILASNWSARFRNDKADFSDTIQEDFDKLSKLEPRIIVVGDLANFLVNPIYYLVSGGHLTLGEVSLIPEKGSMFGASNAIIRQQAGERGFGFVDPSENFCVNVPQLDCNIFNEGDLYFVDVNHLSPKGSSIVGAQIMRSLE